MKKNLLRILCASLLTVVGVSVSAQDTSGSCGADATWEYDSGTLTISGTGEITTYSTENPAAYPWYAYNEDIQSVIISDGITNIPDWAFAMYLNLRTIWLPSSLKSIGNSALEETNLWNVSLPEGLETIGHYAFLTCPFTSICLPSTITYIGQAAFAYCGDLTSVGCYASTPPVFFDNTVFDECTNIETVYVPSANITDYKTATGWSEFGDKIQAPGGYCGTDEDETTATWFFEMATHTLTIEGTKINEYSHSAWESSGMGGSGGGFNPDNNVGYPKGIEHVVIGEGITEIPNSSFYMEIGIKSVILPSTLTSIRMDAFGECFNIETITCNATTPPTLGSDGMENYVIYGKVNWDTYTPLPIEPLTAIYVPAASVAAYKAAPGWSVYADIIVADGGTPEPVATTTFAYTATEKITAFDNYTNFTGATAVQSHNWDEGTGEGIVVYDGTVTALGERALKSQSKLTAITIPESVTSVGNRALEGCTKLTTVTFAGTPTVKTIGTYALAGCDALTTFAVPNGVNSIGEGAFRSCDNLVSVTIPESVTTIGENCFMYCKELTTVDFTGTPAVSIISKNMFQYCEALTTIAIPASVITISDDAFNECTALSSVTFPGISSLTTIGCAAFQGCTNLETIALPESLTTIGSFQEMGGETYYNGSVFWGAGITSIEIPKNLTTIYGGGHFANCPITSLTVNAANTKFDSRDGCNGIIETATDKFVVGCVASSVPDGIKTIGLEAFFAEDKPFSLTLPESVTVIEKRAFHYSTGLKSINIPSGVTEIPAESFAQCDFTTLVIPDGVTSIGEMAFVMCMSLKTLTLGSRLTEIADWAFMCPNVSDVYCYADPTKLTWNGNGFADDGSTRVHVTAADIETWETTFPDANVTFVGDLKRIPDFAGNDGKMTIADITVIIRIANGEITDETLKTAADYDNNGTVDAADVEAFINLMLEK